MKLGEITTQGIGQFSILLSYGEINFILIED